VVTHGGYIGKRLGAFELAVGAPDYQGAKDTRALAADPTSKGPGKGSGAALPSLRVLPVPPPVPQERSKSTWTEVVLLAV
jgi:hypothetical protein